MKQSIYFLLVLVLTGCFDLYNPTYWEDDPYYIIRDPAGNDFLVLYYKVGYDGGIGRKNRVTAIGANNKYLIIESEHHRFEDIKRYWIIDREEDSELLNGVEIIEGPFNKYTFEQAKRKRGIEDLEFDEEF